MDLDQIEELGRMTWFWWTLAVFGAVFVFFLIQSTYLVLALRWGDQRTLGLNYFGLAPAARDRFKKQLRRHARLLQPILWLNRHTGKFDLRKGRIQYKGISAPSGTCSLESFKKAEAYQLTPDLPKLAEWYMSPDLMWWGTWTDHVKGWWDRAQSEPNILFVHFEDMKNDLPAVARQVAAFLGVKPLSDQRQQRPL